MQILFYQMPKTAVLQAVPGSAGAQFHFEIVCKSYRQNNMQIFSTVGIAN